MIGVKNMDNPKLRPLSKGEKVRNRAKGLQNAGKMIASDIKDTQNMLDPSKDPQYFEKSPEAANPLVPMELRNLQIPDHRNVVNVVLGNPNDHHNYQDNYNIQNERDTANTMNKQDPYTQNIEENKVPDMEEMDMQNDEKQFGTVDTEISKEPDYKEFEEYKAYQENRKEEDTNKINLEDAVEVEKQIFKILE
jgi:hypothetical protein